MAIFLLHVTKEACSEVIGENEATRLEKMEHKLCAYNIFLRRRLKEFLQYGSKKDHKLNC